MKYLLDNTRYKFIIVICYMHRLYEFKTIGKVSMMIPFQISLLLQEMSWFLSASLWRVQFGQSRHKYSSAPIK